MSAKDCTVYLNEKCPQGCFIRIVSRFFKVSPTFEFINTMSPEVLTKLLSYSPTKTQPLLKDGDLFISGTLPIIRYLLSYNEEVKKLLVGCCPKIQATCDMWLNFLINSISPIVFEINCQLNGRKRFNKDVFDTAINDLVSQLEIVNKSLMYKTFLDGNSIALPDLLLCSYVLPMFNKVLVDNFKAKIPHVIRHFYFVKEIKEVKDILGEATPCKEIMKPLPFVEPTEKTVDKKDGEKAKEDKKKDKKEKKENNKEQKEKKENKTNKEKENNKEKKEKNNNQKQETKDEKKTQEPEKK